MRKALWAVGLLAASFAGGAVLNGPGLRLARSIVHGRNGGADPIPVLDDELRRSAAGLPPTAKVDAPGQPEPEEPPTGRGVSPPPSTTPTPDPPPAIVEAPPAPVAAEAPKPSAWPDAPGSAPATRQDPPARLDAGVVPVGIPELAAAPPEPLEAPAPRPAPAQSAGGWDAVKKSMRDLGVTRYWVEGTAEGRSTFRCVVPLAGKRAVAQQFEAEADDPAAAAESALRRVALWKAAEAP